MDRGGGQAPGRKVGWLGNVLLVLNLFAPIGLYVLAMGLTNGGSRDEEWLLLVPGWLFAAGLALMALGRGLGGLQPIKPLRGSGEMSFPRHGWVDAGHGWVDAGYGHFWRAEKERLQRIRN